MSRKKESLIIITMKMKDEEDIDEVTPFNMPFSKCLVSYKGASTSIMCWPFPLSLKSNALKWFRSLTLRSIDLWLDVWERFRFSFSTNKERPKIEANLSLIQQEPEEPLREYISRFNKEARVANNLQSEERLCEGRISFLHIHLKISIENPWRIPKKSKNIHQLRKCLVDRKTKIDWKPKCTKNDNTKKWQIT